MSTNIKVNYKFESEIQNNNRLKLCCTCVDDETEKYELNVNLEELKHYNNNLFWDCNNIQEAQYKLNNISNLKIKKEGLKVKIYGGDNRNNFSLQLNYKKSGVFRNINFLNNLMSFKLFEFNKSKDVVIFVLQILVLVLLIISFILSTYATAEYKKLKKENKEIKQELSNKISNVSIENMGDIPYNQQPYTFYVNLRANFYDLENEFNKLQSNFGNLRDDTAGKINEINNKINTINNNINDYFNYKSETNNKISDIYAQINNIYNMINTIQSEVSALQNFQIQSIDNYRKLRERVEYNYNDIQRLYDLYYSLRDESYFINFNYILLIFILLLNIC